MLPSILLNSLHPVLEKWAFTNHFCSTLDRIDICDRESSDLATLLKFHGYQRTQGTNGFIRSKTGRSQIEWSAC